MNNYSLTDFLTVFNANDANLLFDRYKNQFSNDFTTFYEHSCTIDRMSLDRLQNNQLNKVFNELLKGSGTSNIVHEPTAKTWLQAIEYLQTVEACFTVEIKENIVFIYGAGFSVSFLANEVNDLYMNANNLQFEYNNFVFLFDYKTGLNVHSQM